MRIRYYIKRIAAGRYRDTRTGRFVSRAFAARSRAAQRGWVTRRARIAAEKLWEPGRPIPAPTISEAPWSHPQALWRVATWDVRVAWPDAAAFVRAGAGKLRVRQNALMSARVRIGEEWYSLSRYMKRDAALYDISSSWIRLRESYLERIETVKRAAKEAGYRRVYVPRRWKLMEEEHGIEEVQIIWGVTRESGR